MYSSEYPPCWGGAGNHVRRICELLKDYVDLTLITATYGQPKVAFELENLAKLHINNYVLLLAQYLTGLRLLQPRPCDIVHIHVPHAFIPNGNSIKVSTFHVVWSQYSRALKNHRPISIFDIQVPWMNRRLLNTEKLLAQNSDAVVAVSRSVKNELVASYDVDPERIHVIYNGIDIRQFRDDNGKREDIILFVGRQTTHKGLPYLIEAFSKFVRYHTSYKLVLVGEQLEGRIDSSLVELSRKLGIENKVEFTGRVHDADVRRLMAKSRCLVLPSLAESFGMAILEAMASGTPVIASDVGGIPELVRDKYNGLLVPPAKTDRLADALETLASDVTLQKEFARRGKETCRMFSWAEAASKTFRVYEELCS